ncbi:WHG domain-containing protein [Oricola sp.]|uniref:TetR/AcrR family transcriptional regulator n=1 Tax=Oricola sp. TaxID=1979950 RepID=UPI0025E9F26E|nr:WHG domain-containing protein [Oricola sp.]MCI5074922.1 WHG domain-containing protein [Oricola sp.]
MNDKRYHHGNLKEALVEAGLEILGESGLAGLSLRTCAARVGVSHTAPKNHFGTMSGLLTAIAARGYAQLADRMRRDLADDATRRQIRNAAFRGYVDFARAQPALFELMFSGGRTNRDDPALKEGVMACFEILRAASQDLDWDKADLPDAELRAQIMTWSLVHGFAQLALAGKLDKEATKTLGILDIVPDFGFRD